jgi:lipoprotein NlpD
MSAGEFSIKGWYKPLVCSLLLLLGGCSYHSLAPVSDRHQPYHTVEKGETLYSIAFRYGLDYRKVATLNHLRAPYKIHPHQRLSLVAKTRRPLKKALISKKRPLMRHAKLAPHVTTIVKKLKLRIASSIAWRWPTHGTIISQFSPSIAGNNGIDIAGQYGQLIYTTAPGIVVYCGSGLRGYGQLIIIKHNDELLSAYAHNSQVLVKEGMAVKTGQAIAKMGNTDSKRIKLHFEIRLAGKPIDPLIYLRGKP